MSAPVFQHGHLRLYLLQALVDGPRHGYDIIAALTERFDGRYRPSAGSVYPRLARLVNEGLLSVRSDGRKRVYELTEAGRAELAARADEVSEVNELVDESAQQLALDVRARIAESLTALQTDLGESVAGERILGLAGWDGLPDGSGRAAGAESALQQSLRAEAEVALATASSRLLVELARASARGELTAARIATLSRALDSLRA